VKDNIVQHRISGSASLHPNCFRNFRYSDTLIDSAALCRLTPADTSAVQRHRSATSFNSGYAKCPPKTFGFDQTHRIIRGRYVK